jgi:thiol-disulfide isomerase/thioredoxin
VVVGVFQIHACKIAAVFMLGCSLASCSTPAAKSGRKHEPARPQLIPAIADASDVAPGVVAELERARAAQATLLVYVGASWCEPCRRFHDALAAGELDLALTDARFLEFDYDRSHEALARAGYVSTLIPLFVLPMADGKASERRIEGSIKGPSAVAQNLLPRLKTLLAGEPNAR